MNRAERRFNFFAAWLLAIKMDIDLHQHVEALRMDKARDKALARREAYMSNPSQVNLKATLAGCQDKGLMASYAGSMPVAMFGRLVKKTG